MIRLIKKLAVSMAVGLACVGLLSMTAKSAEAPAPPLLEMTVTAVNPKPKTTPTRYTEPRGTTVSMSSWMALLQSKESGSLSDPDHAKILDTNGKFSYGCLQFQMQTFKSFSSLYGMEGDIYDCQFQHSLARRMLADKYSYWKQWYNSVLVIGLPPRS